METETSVAWLKQLLELMGYPATVTAEIKPSIDKTEEAINCWLTIDHSHLRPHQIQALIGIDGASLDAIQVVANVALNAHLGADETHCFYTIELNNYRAERQLELQQIAEAAAEQVKQTQSEYEIKDLSAAERRLVHMFLKEYTEIETFSQGKEPNRHLIVRLIKD